MQRKNVICKGRFYTSPFSLTEIYKGCIFLALKGGKSIDKAATHTHKKMEEKTMDTLSELSKKAIMECYSLMKDYLHDEDSESVDCFLKLRNNISKLEIAIPVPIYKEIYRFLFQELGPIALNTIETFESCYTEDIGAFEEDNLFHIKSEEGARQMAANFWETLYEIEARVEEFGRAVLRPYLITE